MALNKYMHPRNFYKHNKPNFKDLAEKFDFFREVVMIDEQGRFSIDFKLPNSLAALSKALLLKDFDLHLEFPSDRLIPTVPLRLNYILWLEDIIKGDVKILDIGVGASCIYPLLGAKKNSWHFYGTEIDSRNYTISLENIKANNMESLITVFHITDKSSSLDTVFETNNVETPKYLHAVMANPPFFCDTSDAIGAATTRSMARPSPKTVSLAARHESQAPGGEVYFCMRLAKDSLKYASRVGVFTVMLGKKSSVAAVKRILRRLKIPRVSVYEMCQGRIMRWGIAWTFLPKLNFPESEFRRLRKSERPPLTWVLPASVSCLSDYSKDALIDWLREEFRQLNMKVLDQKNRADIGGIHLNITAYTNTWTHARRKRREAQRLALVGDSVGSDSSVSHISTEVNMPDSGTNTNPHLPDVTNGTESLKRTLDPNSDSPTNSPHPPNKRPHLDEVCEEGAAWEDTDDDHLTPEFGLVCQPVGQSNTQTVHIPDPIVQANVFVENLQSETPEPDDSDLDDETLVQQACCSTTPLVVKIAFLNGSCREAPNQILCYLKNRLK